METIESVEKSYIRRIMTAIFCVCVISAAGLYYAMHQSLMEKEGEFALFAVILPNRLFGARAVRIVKLRKVERAQWLGAYRASPESHLLQLND